MLMFAQLDGVVVWRHEQILVDIVSLTTGSNVLCILKVSCPGKLLKRRKQ